MSVAVLAASRKRNGIRSGIRSGIKSGVRPGIRSGSRSGSGPRISSGIRCGLCGQGRPQNGTSCRHVVVLLSNPTHSADSCNEGKAHPVRTHMCFKVGLTGGIVEVSPVQMRWGSFAKWRVWLSTLGAGHGRSDWSEGSSPCSEGSRPCSEGSGPCSEGSGPCSEGSGRCSEGSGSCSEGNGPCSEESGL